MKPYYLSLITFCTFFAMGCKNQKVPEQVNQYSIKQLYDNENISASGFNADESEVLVTSNRSGIYNVGSIGIADTAIKPLTHSIKDSYFSIDYVPGTNNYLYSADKGGDENDHIYLQKQGSTTATDLTPWPKSKSSFLAWSKDKKSLYILSNKRNVQYFDIWKLNTATWSPVLLYQNDEGYEPQVISKSERYIALSKPITTDKSDLYLYDMQSKVLKTISNANVAVWNAQDFENDDSSLYYTTNDRNEFSYLAKYNIASGKTQKMYATNWDVLGLYLSKNQKYHTIFLNEDGKVKAILFDHSSNKPVPLPKINDGQVKSILIASNEDKAVLTVGSSTSPDNIYLYSFANKQLKQLSHTLNSAIDPKDMVSAQVVHFKSFDGKEIPAIYYKPLSASKGHKVPALLWIHGGPGGQTMASFNNNIQYLVNHGYAVLAVNNRGSSGYGKTFYALDNKDHSNGDLKDCIWGKKWLQQQDYIDTAKIAIEGGSYGGCMVLGALAFHPNEFKAGVDLFGVANWLRTLRSIPPYWASSRKALYDEMGDPNTLDSVHLRKISPLFNYQHINKPLLVFQGLNDVRVLPVESKEIAEGVKKNGVPVEYITYPNEGHGFIRKDNQMKTAEITLRFLDKYVKNAH